MVDDMTWLEYRSRVTARVRVKSRAALEARFESRIEARAELGGLVGARRRDEPIHRWAAYKEAYSPQLVRTVIDYLGLTAGHVLDPFAGVGTTLVVAAERGLTATGVELLPFPAFAAATKLAASRVRPNKALEIAHGAAMDRRRVRGSFPDFPIRDWAFSEPVLAELTRLYRSVAEEEPGADRDMCLLALLSVVEEVSQAVKDGTSLRRRGPGGRRPGRYGAVWSRRQVRELFLERVDTFLADIAVAPAARGCRCLTGDARTLPRQIRAGHSTLAMFSPPYPNRYDYCSNYQMELGFGFVEDRCALKALRHDQLRSHLECPWPEQRTVELPALDEFCAALLAGRRTKDETNRVFKMVAGYFEDMAAVLEQVNLAMAAGGHVAIVVGTQVFSGQALPTDLLIAQLAEDRLGMNLKALWVAREKGVAAQQRQRFDTLPRSRESILILEK